MIMVKVEFKYKDRYTNGEWKKQSCIVTSVEECKGIYGLDLDPDCEYEILNVEEVET